MTVKEAKEIAKEWVEKRAAELPDFYGAYCVGSFVHLNNDELYPSCIDIDVRILVERELPNLFHRVSGEFKQIKLSYKGVILEPICFSKDENLCAEKILGDAEANHWCVPNVMLDPTGELARIQQEVAEHYAEKKWILRRCESWKAFALYGLEQSRNPDLLPGWSSKFILKVLWFCQVYLAGVAQIPCLANLEGITYRKAFVYSRRTLEQYGEDRLYHSLLLVFGSDGISEKQVRGFLEELAEAYDYAIKIHRTPFWADLEIREAARPNAIDGSLDVINSGYNQEAMLWILIVRSWSQVVIDNDAPAREKRVYQERYQELLSALGYSSDTSLEQKREATEALMPNIMKVAKRIAEKTGR